MKTFNVYAKALVWAEIMVQADAESPEEALEMVKHGQCDLIDITEEDFRIRSIESIVAEDEDEDIC